MQRLAEAVAFFCLAGIAVGAAAQSDPAAGGTPDAAAGPAVPGPLDAANSSALFASGTEAFERGDFAAALAGFEAARAAGMSGPAVLYDIGVARYKLGRNAEAEQAFRELAAGYPAMRELAQYNLGLTLIRQDRMVEARDAFEGARRSDDAKIRALADAMLARIAPAEAAAALATAERSRDPDRLRLLDVGVGFDGNVALVDEASLPLGTTTDSPLAQVFGLFRGRPRPALPFVVDASGYLIRYADAGEFDQAAVRLGAAYAWDIQGWRLETGPYYSHSSLAGNSFERRIGAAVDLRHGLGEASTLRLRFAREGIDDLDPQFDYVAGTRDRLSLDFRHRSARGRLSLGYAHEANDREGPGVSPRRDEVYAGYEVFVTPDWSFEAQGFLRASRYADLVVTRDEDLAELRLAARRDLRAGWLLEGEWRIGSNDSNDARYSYDRTRLDIGLSKLF